MDLINPGKLEVGRPGFPYFLYVLRVIALCFGYLLAGTGWLIFLLFLRDAGTAGFGAEFFHIIGIAVASGWLLLRFAGGLFPFSSDFFPWQKRSG